MATAAVTKFLAAHPAFAKMSHAEREKYRASHPAFNTQWIEANGFTGTWGNTAKAPVAAPSKAAAAPPGSPAAAAAAAEAPVPATQVPLNALPYDASADDMEAAGWSNFNDINNQLNSSDSEIGSAQTRGLRDLNESKDPIYRRLLNNYGARGMGRSTGYISAKGVQDNQFANAETDINQNASFSTARNVAARASAKDALNAILENARKRRSATAAGKYMV